MSNEIIKVLNALCEKFGIAIDWTADNVLPYVEKLLGKFVIFEIATSILTIVLTGVVFCILLKLAIYLCKKSYEIDWDIEPISLLAAFVSVITVACGIFLVCALATESYDIVEAITFPEKMIYDELVSLINAGTYK